MFNILKHETLRLSYLGGNSTRCDALHVRHEAYFGTDKLKKNTALALISIKYSIMGYEKAYHDI